MGKYFGTDGVRGVAGETLTNDMALRIGNALKETFNAGRVVIGGDTRKSSDLFGLSVATGAMAAGIDVEYAGVVSTPMIAHYSKQENIVGIMVTASHNPYQDNGIKVFNSGYKMKPEEETVVEAYMDGEKTLSEKGFGAFMPTDKVETTYRALYDGIDTEKTNLSVCLDTANGATYEIAEKILKGRVDEVHVIHNDPDGFNINKNCGSTHMEALKNTVIEGKYDVGFSFDGDGDRVLAVDHQGRLYDGDLLVYIIATHMKEEGRLNKNTVVLTKMSNPGIVKAFKDKGIKVVRTDVGDKYVTAEMRKSGYSIGGENSGHIIINDRLQTGDGVLVASEVLKILQKRKQPIVSLVENVEFYPQTTKNIKNVDKTVVDNKAVKQAVKDAKKTLGSDALLLVRPSGTEPLVRITVSHPENAMVESTIQTLETVILKHGRDENA